MGDKGRIGSTVPLPYGHGSEHEFHAELDLARGGGGAGDQAGGGTGCSVGKYDGVRRPEVGMIQRVEEFRADLQLELFSESHIFEQRQIEIGESGT